jgi:hypothetical protein
MATKRLRVSELLDEAISIIIALEQFADVEMQEDLEESFQEITDADDEGITMEAEQLSKLLGKFLNIIIVLKPFADVTMQEDIEALLQEFKYGDYVDSEMLNYTNSNIWADLEAQDFDTFGEDKI